MRVKLIENVFNHSSECLGGIAFPMGFRCKGNAKLHQSRIVSRAMQSTITNELYGLLLNDSELEPSMRQPRLHRTILFDEFERIIVVKGFS